MENVNVVYDGFVKVFKDGIHEIVKVTDSISVLIFDVITSQFVFVEQPRPAMNYSPQADNLDGKLLEAPAGRFDYNTTVKKLIVNEVKEETGIIITEDDVELLNDGEALALSPGILTEMMFLAYVEIDTKDYDLDESKFGNAKEGEDITRRLISVDHIQRMFFKDIKTFALIQWFMAEKWPYYSQPRYKKNKK